MIQEAEEQVRIIRENLKTAQTGQKSQYREYPVRILDVFHVSQLRRCFSDPIRGVDHERLISKITSHIESTLFAFLIKQSVSLDVITSSFSRFSGLIIPREKLLGSEKIVFDWSTPLSFRRPLNLGTRFFQVGASCHIPSSGMLKASQSFVHHV